MNCLVICVWFVSLTLTIIEARECCCTQLDHVNENVDHYLMNSATLFNNSDLFFRNNAMVNNCGITKINMTTVSPRKPRKWGWVTYIGDSLSRGIFYTLANQFSGWKPTDDIPLDKMILKQEGIYPLLGEHEGPKSDNELGGKLETFHNSKLLCCSNTRTQEELSTDDRCHYAMQNEDDFGDAVTHKFRSHLFHDVSEYIEKSMAPRFGHEGFMCISFLWAPTFNSATKILDSLYKPSHQYQPQAIIMNMNMHQCTMSEDELDVFVNHTNFLYKSMKEPKPPVIYHAPSALDKSNPNFGSQCTNTGLLKIINLFNRKLKSWHFVTKYLNYFGESIRAHKLGCSHDGVHLSFVCAHDMLLMLWDFNWLRKFGIIESDVWK